MIPDALADMMRMAMVMERSPAVPALRAIQEPLRGSEMTVSLDSERLVLGFGLTPLPAEAEGASQESESLVSVG